MKYRLLYVLLVPFYIIVFGILLFISAIAYIITGDPYEWMNKVERFEIKLRHKGKKV